MVFATMVVYFKKKIKRFHGEIFLVYLAGYGTGRAIIEFIRTDQLYIPGTKIPVSMVLGIVMAVVSVIMILIGRSRASTQNLENLEISADGSLQKEAQEISADGSPQKDTQEIPADGSPQKDIQEIPQDNS